MRQDVIGHRREYCEAVRIPRHQRLGIILVVAVDILWTDFGFMDHKANSDALAENIISQLYAHYSSEMLTAELNVLESKPSSSSPMRSNLAATGFDVTLHPGTSWCKCGRLMES